MLLTIVRHGHPDYVKDCLTELGHKQAEAAGKRMENEYFDKVYSSTMGRAFQTAQHIVENRNLEIEQLDFIREIDSSPISGHWNEGGSFGAMVDDEVKKGRTY